MNERLDELQDMSAELNQHMLPILTELLKTDDVTCEAMVLKNLSSFATYGQLLLEMSKAFGLKPFYKNAEAISKIWNDVSNGSPFELFGISTKELIAAMFEISSSIAEIVGHGRKTCPACGQKTYYFPYEYAFENDDTLDESVTDKFCFLNRNEYICPFCRSNDRERLITHCLDRIGIDKLNLDERMLMINPSQGMKHMVYARSTSLKCDEAELNKIEDNKRYDYILYCAKSNETENIEALASVVQKHLDEYGIAIMSFNAVTEENGLGTLNKEILDVLSTYEFESEEIGIEYFGGYLYKKLALNETSEIIAITKNAFAKEILDGKKVRKYRADNKKPLVSVILSAYNHAEFVEQTVLSVINQTYKNIEFLVADDCSQDATPEILKKYERHMSKLLLFNKNFGSRHRELLQHATGKYIAVIHSDDIWEKNKIEKQVDFLEANPDYAACFTGVQMVDERGNCLPDTVFKMQNMKSGEWIRYFLYNGNCLCHPSILIKSDIYKDLDQQICHTFRQLSDFYQWIKLLQKERIHVIEQRLIYFRTHSASGNINESAPTAENTIRTINESEFIWFKVISNMNDENFTLCFKQDFVKPTASSHIEIQCEKILLMRNSTDAAHKQLCLQLFYELCSNKEVVHTLKEDYNINFTDFYDIAGEITTININNNAR